MVAEPDTARPDPDGRGLPYTKIVATIGPGSETRVGEMLDAGMSVARLNFSHGTPEDHRRRVRAVRRAAEERTTTVGILADLPGPKMRTGTFAGGEVDVSEGETWELRPGSGRAGPGEILIDVDDLLSSLDPGHRVMLADGQVELRVERVEPDAIVARVRRGGSIGDRKGVHLPGARVRYSVPTDHDRELIAFAIEEGIDMLGVSFVGQASELASVRELAPHAALVSKIERTAALENLGEILAASDGVMVARGDLGVEVQLEELPLIQKSLIHDAVTAGRFTITATEMLESMVSSSRPTRAEVTDVANAILDGTDAVMLSAETAVGEYPVEAILTMRRIALAVERSQRYHDRPRLGFRSSESNFSNATAMAAVQAAEALGIDKIVCFTETGNTVRLVSRYRPNAEIIALSPNLTTVHHMSVLAHVRPLPFRREPSLEDMLYMAAEMLVVRGMADYGDRVVFVAGVPPGVASSTNVMKLHRIGEQVKLH